MSPPFLISLPDLICWGRGERLGIKPGLSRRRARRLWDGPGGETFQARKHSRRKSRFARLQA
jgi:hypothetical protein